MVGKSRWPALGLAFWCLLPDRRCWRTLFFLWRAMGGESMGIPGEEAFFWGMSWLNLTLLAIISIRFWKFHCGWQVSYQKHARISWDCIPHFPLQLLWDSWVSGLLFPILPFRASLAWSSSWSRLFSIRSFSFSLFPQMGLPGDEVWTWWAFIKFWVRTPRKRAAMKYEARIMSEFADSSHRKNIVGKTMTPGTGCPEPDQRSRSKLCQAVSWYYRPCQVLRKGT